jgi:hypothetical protein
MPSIQPIGTTVSRSSTEFTYSALLIRSSQPDRTREPGNMEAPVAMKTSSSTWATTNLPTRFPRASAFRADH